MERVKYRAWHIDSKVMFDVLGIAFQNNQIVVKWHGAERAIDVNQFELMQYIGKQDKNGKDIFEGDRVKSIQWYFGTNTKRPVEKIGAVKYLSKSASFVFDVGNYLTLCADNIELEVIGHIYQKENPQLS